MIECLDYYNITKKDNISYKNKKFWYLLTNFL